MKQVQVLLLAMVVGGAGLLSQVFAQNTTRETEGLTVVRENDAGDVQVLTKQKEVVTTEKTVRDREAAKDIKEADDTPRKARVMVSPAVWQREYRRKFDRELNEKWGITDPGVIENPGYTSFLTDALVNTRKFDMLEREDLQTLIKELDFGETDYVDMQKVQKIGNQMGADYVVIPEIRYINITEEEKEVPYVAKKQAYFTCKIATAVRTVDVASGKIVSYNITENEGKLRLRDSDEGKKNQAVIDLLSDTQKDACLKEAANIADVAYPIKIMSINDDTVMLNRGKGAINEGEILNVYAAGEMMVDPDTKESLGYNEALIGKIKVTEVNNKTCQATILERSGEIKKLSICRRLSNSQKIEELKAGNTPPPKID